MSKKTSKNAEKKTIKIACLGAGELSIKLMTPFQGDLKTLSDENLEAIKNEILTDGFSFPIAIWEDPEKNQLFIIDGHQRHKALLSLQKDGYSIPEIPVIFVEAESYDQAKHKLLAAASVYGEIQTDGVLEFLKDTKISVEDITKNLKLQINLDDFISKYDSKSVDEIVKEVGVTGHTRELNQNKVVEDKKEFMILIHCKDESEQSDLYSQLKEEGFSCKIID